MTVVYVVDTVPQIIKHLQDYGTLPTTEYVEVKKITTNSGAWWYEVIIHDKRVD